jgi:hypothetical protein
MGTHRARSPSQQGIMKRPIGSGPTLSSSNALRQSGERAKDVQSAYPVPRSNSEFKAVRGRLDFNCRHVVCRRCRCREPWRWTDNCWEAAGDDVRRPTGKHACLAQGRAMQGCRSDSIRCAAANSSLQQRQVSVAPYIVRPPLTRASKPVAQAGGQDRLRQGLGIGRRGVDRGLSPEAAQELMMAR